jgi:hypothetical protein
MVEVVVVVWRSLVHAASQTHDLPLRWGSQRGHGHARGMQRFAANGETPCFLFLSLLYFLALGHPPLLRETRNGLSMAWLFDNQTSGSCRTGPDCTVQYCMDLHAILGMSFELA